jgi:hypothetical protein
VIGQLLFESVAGAVEPIRNDGVGLEPSGLQATCNDVCDTVYLMIDTMHIVSYDHPGHFAQVVPDPVGASGHCE